VVTQKGARRSPTPYSQRAVHVVVHYAEVGLKGRNRRRFEDRLIGNLERVLADLGGARVRWLWGRILVELPDDVPFERARERIARVFGIAYFARATLCEPTLEAIERAVDERVDAAEFQSFGVRARRTDRSFPASSQQLNEQLGARVVERTGARVDLTRPDLWLELHVLSREVILLWERVPGPGGMPVGSAGRVVSLISGGIDSPVASWAAQKRGCEVIFAHFHSSPFTSTASQDKVRDLVALLARWGGPARLWLIPFGELQQVLVREAPSEPRIVLYRRFMLRLAEALAERAGALALVTGDSLGQVSSQTLGNLDTINRAATLPVLRPLIGMDKNEIVERARAIGSYEISIEPDEDCCSYLMPRRPATWTRPEPIEAIEARLDVKGMLDAALARASEERIRPSA
jgi:thiamine biosynthesis protein ThiI